MEVGGRKIDKLIVSNARRTLVFTKKDLLDDEITKICHISN